VRLPASARALCFDYLSRVGGIRRWSTFGRLTTCRAIDAMPRWLKMCTRLTKGIYRSSCRRCVSGPQSSLPIAATGLPRRDACWQAYQQQVPPVVLNRSRYESLFRAVSLAHILQRFVRRRVFPACSLEGIYMYITVTWVRDDRGKSCKETREGRINRGIIPVQEAFALSFLKPFGAWGAWSLESVS
jgi:hypothetical protein